jgi:hypothetical protein
LTKPWRPFINSIYLQIILLKGVISLKKLPGAGDKIEEAAEALIKRGIPERTAAYAASMGYLREIRKKK